MNNEKAIINLTRVVNKEKMMITLDREALDAAYNKSGLAKMNVNLSTSDMVNFCIYKYLLDLELDFSMKHIKSNSISANRGPKNAKLVNSCMNIKCELLDHYRFKYIPEQEHIDKLVKSFNDLCLPVDMVNKYKDEDEDYF